MPEHMLEKILASKSKSNLLAFFLINPERSFFIGEIQKRVGGRALHSDLRSFQKMGLLGSYTQRGKRYYQVNPQFPEYAVLRGSLLKNFKSYEDELMRNLKRLGGLRYAILSGIFTGTPKLECDILLVGKLSKRQVDDFVYGAERLMGQELNYAVMDENEFMYRKDTFDRFMKDIYENPHIVAVNKMKL